MVIGNENLHFKLETNCFNCATDGVKCYIKSVVS